MIGLTKKSQSPISSKRNHRNSRNGEQLPVKLYSSLQLRARLFQNERIYKICPYCSLLFFKQMLRWLVILKIDSFRPQTQLKRFGGGVKSVQSTQVVHQAGVYPNFCSMKQLARSISNSPVDGMLVHRRVTPSLKLAGTHLERGTVTV